MQQYNKEQKNLNFGDIYHKQLAESRRSIKISVYAISISIFVLFPVSFLFGYGAVVAIFVVIYLIFIPSLLILATNLFKYFKLKNVPLETELSDKDKKIILNPKINIFQFTLSALVILGVLFYVFYIIES